MRDVHNDRNYESYNQYHGTTYSSKTFIQRILDRLENTTIYEFLFLVLLAILTPLLYEVFFRNEGIPPSEVIPPSKSKVKFGILFLKDIIYKI